MIRPHHVLGTAALVAAPLAALIAAPPPPAPAAPAAWARCSGCHSAQRGGPAEVGPNLWGVYGAKAGARPGYAYSPALKKTGIVWSKATLSPWLVDSQKVVPGTMMPNQELKPADRDAVIAYLQRLK